MMDERDVLFDGAFAGILGRAAGVGRGESRTRAVAAMAEAHAAGARQRSSRRTVWLLRGAVAAAVLALAAGGLVLPGRVRGHRARLIMANVANAMAAADAIYLEFHGTEEGRELASRFAGGGGLRFDRLASQSWYMSRTAYYTRWRRWDGSISRAQGLDLRAGRWWFYAGDGENGTIYVADVKAQRERISGLLANGLEFVAHSGAWGELLGNQGLDEPRATAETVHRDGGAVTILTFTGQMYVGNRRADGARLVARNVFEIDPQTDYLLSARYYLQLPGEEEHLVRVIDHITYGTGVPVQMTVPPSASRSLPAEVTLTPDTFRGTACIVMKLRAGGETMEQIIVPAEEGTDRARPEPEALSNARRDLLVANMGEISDEIQRYLAEHDGIFPPVGPVGHVHRVPLVDRFQDSQELFMLPGRDDVCVVGYYVPSELNAGELPDLAGVPIIVADDVSGGTTVIAYADGHIETSEAAVGPEAKWWIGWWRDFEASRAIGVRY
jgi:hypothetical protein